MGETTHEERDAERRLLKDFEHHPDTETMLHLLNDADRLAAIERSVRELADEYDESAENRCGCCDPEIVNTIYYGCACQNAGDAVSEGRDQQSREVACRLRTLIDAPDAGKGD